MASRRRAAVYAAASSYTSTAFGIITNLMLVPIYLKYFSLETYGAWLASGGVVFMLGVMDGGLSTIVLQRLGARAGSSDVTGFCEVAGSGWTLNACLCFCMVGVGVLISPWVPGWVHAPSADLAALRLGFCCGAVGTAMSLAQSNLLFFAQARQCTGVLVLASGVAQVAGLLGTLVALQAGFGVTALGLALMVRGGVGLIIACVYVYRAWGLENLPRPRCTRQEIKTQLMLMGPTFLGRTVGVALYYGEPSIVSACIGPKAAAVLSLTNKVYGVGLMLLNPLAGGAMAGLAHLSHEGSKARTAAVIAELCGLASAGAAMVFGMALALNRFFLRFWVGPEAYGGLTLSLVLALSALLIQRLNLLGTVLHALGMIGRSSVGAGVEGLVHMAALAVALPRFGLLGVPLSTVVSTVAVTGWYYPHLIAGYFGLRRLQGMLLCARGWSAVGVALAAGALAAWVLEKVSFDLPLTVLLGASGLASSWVLAWALAGSIEARSLLRRLWERYGVQSRGVGRSS